jgi:diacylglycerol kinase (ATP)
MNKMLYAKEGAKDLVDRACADLPYHLHLHVDGLEVPIPEVILAS